MNFKCHICWLRGFQEHVVKGSLPYIPKPLAERLLIGAGSVYRLQTAIPMLHGSTVVVHFGQETVDTEGTAARCA